MCKLTKLLFTFDHLYIYLLDVPVCCCIIVTVIMFLSKLKNKLDMRLLSNNAQLRVPKFTQLTKCRHQLIRTRIGFFFVGELLLYWYIPLLGFVFLLFIICIGFMPTTHTQNIIICENSNCLPLTSSEIYPCHRIQTDRRPDNGVGNSVPFGTEP